MHQNQDPYRTGPGSRLTGTLLGALLGVFLVATVLLAPDTAGAHATAQLYGSPAVADGYGHVFLRIPHGCDGGRATDTVEVSIPAGFTSVKPERKDGWKTRITRNDKGRVTAVTWHGGNLPDDHFEDFGLSVKYPSEPGTYHLPTVQRCGRAEEAWTQVPAAGGNPHDLERPAPRVVVSPAAHTSGHDDTATGAATGAGVDHGGKGIGTKRPRGEALVIPLNTALTVLADLPSTLRGQRATVAVLQGERTTVLGRITLDAGGDLMHSWPRVKTGPEGWRISGGDTVVITVRGEELARADVPARKS